MEKREGLKHDTNPEDKLLLSKILDKVKECSKTNKVVVSDFLDERQVRLVETMLKHSKITNYQVEGFWKQAQRKIIYFYPMGMEEYRKEKELASKVKAIRIELPKETIGLYSHRDYLGGLMKLGIKREKIGDILVEKTGADILFLTELEEYLRQNVPSLTRFRKGNYICGFQK